MKYSKNNKPLVCMQTNSTCYKGTGKMTVKGVLWHSTGANNPSLKRYVQPSDNASDREEMLKLLGVNSNKNDWNHISMQAGLNCWIGKLADGTVTTVQTMPWDYRPWGCGSGKNGSCNDGWIQFEIAEGSLTDKTYFNAVYKEACEITAYLCDMYNLDPYGTVVKNGVKVPVILCHADSYQLGMGTNHGDVLHWFKKHGKTMDDVRKDVAKLMGANNTKVETRGLQATEFQNLSNIQVIEKVGPLFTADQKKSGMLASISLAQFILESGYGKSEFSNATNNMFGMKCSLSGNTWSGSTWDGGAYTRSTDGAKFRTYDCVEDSIADHSAYLLGAKNGAALRYAGLKGETNHRVAADIIKNGGYATAANYADILCDLIERWGLAKYDAPKTTSSALHIGDIVKLVSGATYTSGKAIPSWVFETTLYVRGISGSNITISTVQTGAITGVVNAKYLVRATKDAVVEDKVVVNAKFNVGAEVKLVPGAKYTSGKAVPSWLLNKKLYVRAVDGSNIKVSILKVGAITGVVSAEYLVDYNVLAIGDQVKLASGATYYNGASIPDWVFKQTLYVRNINRDNITISTLKSGAITGVVHKKYLTRM